MEREKEITQITIGMSDSYGYIAVEPPLDDIEIDLLREQSLVPGTAVQIYDEPKSTQLRFAGDMNNVEATTRRAQGMALAVAEALRFTRSGRVDTNYRAVRSL